jgi:hypothetical protein
VQGRLRGEPLFVTVESSCAHCGEQLVLKIDSELTCQVLKGGPEPLLFHPFVDFAAITEPNIINVF